MILATPRCSRCSEPLGDEYVPAVDLGGGQLCELCREESRPGRACPDCGAPARWPFERCDGCLDARFGKAEEYLGELRLADTHSSDVDPGDEAA